MRTVQQNNNTLLIWKGASIALETADMKLFWMRKEHHTVTWKKFPEPDLKCMMFTGVLGHGRVPKIDTLKYPLTRWDVEKISPYVLCIHVVHEYIFVMANKP